MKKYVVLILCLLSLRGTAQNRYEDLGNGTILVHRDIPAPTASSKNMKENPAQHLHFQGISLNISFQNICVPSISMLTFVKVLTTVTSLAQYVAFQISTSLFWVTGMMVVKFMVLRQANCFLISSR